MASIDAVRDCGDCGTKPGGLHQRGCDVERCLLCGGQAISCNCVYEVNGLDRDLLEREHPDVYEGGPTDAMEAVLDARVAALGGRLPWTGRWPGEEECAAWGWWCKRAHEPQPGYVRCGSGDPEAGPDLNRMGQEARWDVQQRQHVMMPLAVVVTIVKV